MLNHSFSDYVVYVDESGDHNLTAIDPDYPYFVLAFCVFRKADYIENVVPALQAFKFKFFGHDMSVLHEHDIRKSKSPFNILLDRRVREPFMEGLSRLIETAPFTIIASVIDKQAHLEFYGDKAHNPYDHSLLYCMEHLQHLLKQRGQERKETHIVLERRGRKEGVELELAFRRFCEENDFRFQPVLAHKQSNSAGLQLADLVARPIGRFAMKPHQANRAYEILKEKLQKTKGPNNIDEA